MKDKKIGGASGAVDARKKYMLDLVKQAKRLGPNSWAAVELKFAKQGYTEKLASQYANSVIEDDMRKNRKKRK